MRTNRDQRLHWWDVIRFITPILLGVATVQLTSINEKFEKLEPLIVKVAKLEERIKAVEVRAGIRHTNEGTP